jgi:hypothetical protein
MKQAWMNWSNDQGVMQYTDSSRFFLRSSAICKGRSPTQIVSYRCRVGPRLTTKITETIVQALSWLVLISNYSVTK